MSFSFRVGAARCTSYDRAEVARALALALERAGGVNALFFGDDEVPDRFEPLLKPNLLAPYDPADAVTTHPEILSALIAHLRERFPHVVPFIADGPGYVFAGQVEPLFVKTGMRRVADEFGASLASIFDLGAVMANGLLVAKRYHEAAFRVNVAKCKTHVETEVSLCVKNLFGIATTDTRKRAHGSRSQRELANAILDLYEVAPPQLHILDAVWGMEGNGPSHGRPREIGWIFAGADAVAVDWVALCTMGYEDPQAVTLYRAARERGLGPTSRREIELVGASWDELPVKGFAKSTRALRWLPTWLRGMGHGGVKLRPVLDATKCVHCGACRDVCPVGAIAMQKMQKMQKNLPVIDAKTCVKCLCCHEMCPTGAMGVGQNWLARLFS